MPIIFLVANYFPPNILLAAHLMMSIFQG